MCDWLAHIGIVRHRLGSLAEEPRESIENVTPLLRQRRSLRHPYKTRGLLLVPIRRIFALIFDHMSTRCSAVMVAVCRLGSHPVARFIFFGNFFKKTFFKNSGHPGGVLCRFTRPFPQSQTTFAGRYCDRTSAWTNKICGTDTVT